jgi:methyltransferase
LRPPKYEELARKYPEFRSKCFIGAGGKVGITKGKDYLHNRYNQICVNFHDPEAVRLIAEILLSEYFELNVIIPPGVLVPRIPQRLNYILLLEDLIYHSKNAIHDPIIGIDIGR